MSHVTDASDDLIQPFMIELSGLRGRLIRMGPVVEDVISRHDLPEAIQGLMAEFVVLAVALSAALKFDGIFTLQAKGNGPIGLMAADVTSDGGVRAYASVGKDVPSIEEIEGSPVPRLFGAGYLAFTVDQGDHTELYQGIVELQGPTLIDCVHHYFQQSDQFDAALTLAAERQTEGGWRAGALMLQRLPEDELSLRKEEMDEEWRRATILMGSCQREELTNRALSPHQLLFRLFHEDGVRVFDTLPLTFSCRCSRERAEGIINMLSFEEIEEYMIDGKISIKCEFCNTEQWFDDTQIEALRAS
ncbi:MAG: Hsp33 family molecular chaperone HslO [Pseudomonadota bacterium]|nr:Hsp33 family molecular chaperone HslO [Pseudomonadota bacterium]